MVNRSIRVMVFLFHMFLKNVLVLCSKCLVWKLFSCQQWFTLVRRFMSYGSDKRVPKFFKRAFVSWLCGQNAMAFDAVLFALIEKRFCTRFLVLASFVFSAGSFWFSWFRFRTNELNIFGIFVSGRLTSKKSTVLPVVDS